MSNVRLHKTALTPVGNAQLADDGQSVLTFPAGASGILFQPTTSGTFLISFDDAPTNALTDGLSLLNGLPVDTYVFWVDPVQTPSIYVYCQPGKDLRYQFIAYSGKGCS